MLNGIKVIDDIIQGYLKWFHKKCTKEENSINSSEEIIRDMQKKFQEVKEKKTLTKLDFSNIAHVEAMLIINRKHLQMYEEKVRELCKEKEV